MSQLRVAVAGNPNSGKTTLFNAMTGARARVGNYPGVTVERKVAQTTLPSGRTTQVIDLPGCYSLTARSAEEEVAHEVLMGHLGDPRPDVVVCVIDATNLARGLYLAHQLIEMELPLVVVLNMIDVARARGIHLDVPALAQRLGLPVLTTAARDGEGIAALLAMLDSAELPKPVASDGGWLQLAPQEQQALDAVGAALTRANHSSVLGERLWWLTSDLDNLSTLEVANADSELLEIVRSRRRELDPQGDGAFNRRIIEGRYRRVDGQLAGIVDDGDVAKRDLGHRLDKLLLHPVGGIAVFVLTMFLLFQAVFAWADPLIASIEWLMGGMANGVAALLPAGLLRSLLVNGVLAGIGNVLVFLPQIALLFLGLAILEESGYLARAAFLLDGVMRRVGLHGKSFIPLMSSFACAVPGVMAARTVESRRDRLVTIFVAPFMSCSARLPVYVLVIGALFATATPAWGFLSVGGLVITAMYFLGFAAAIFTAWLLKRTLLRSPPPPFILELPAYQRPLVRQVLRQVWTRCGVFVSQTGSVILAISLVLWALLAFPRDGLGPETYQAERAAIVATTADASQQQASLAQLERRAAAAQLEGSVAGRIGHLIEPLIAPLGFDWRIGIGLVASFAAREVLVTTLGQVYALDADIEADSPALRDALLADIDPATGAARFSPLVGMSLLVFFVLAMQCMSTVATVRRETNSWRWPLAQLVYMNTLAYVASLIVYQGGHFLGLG